MKFISAFEKIKEELKNASVDGLDENMAIQVNLTNRDCAGTFYVAYINGEFSVEPYDYKDNSASIDVTVADFLKLCKDELDIDKSIEKGRLYIFGDTEKVRKLATLLEPVEKKVEKQIKKQVKSKVEKIKNKITKK